MRKLDLATIYSMIDFNSAILKFGLVFTFLSSLMIVSLVWFGLILSISVTLPFWGVAIVVGIGTVGVLNSILGYVMLRYFKWRLKNYQVGLKTYDG